MIKKISILLICIANFTFSNAQNLVVNGSFESYNALPLQTSEWYKCNSWNNVSLNTAAVYTNATPDYFNAQQTFVSAVDLPESFAGYINAHTGDAIMGFLAYNNVGVVNDFREYLSSQLSSPMQIGLTYTVSFWMSNAENSLIKQRRAGSKTDGIGVHFSTSPLSQTGHAIINVVPQLVIPGQPWDTAWAQYSFTFTPTQAFEYITIGNFLDDASQTRTVADPGAYYEDDSYYFLDDVVVESACVTLIDTISACNSYTWTNGVSYNTSNNIAMDTLPGFGGGCDTVVTLNLTITNAVTSTDVQSACDSYMWIDGNTYTADNNTATETFVAANGCDSIIVLDLTITTTVISTDEQSACETYIWIDGITYTTNNNTATHTIANGAANGCDSVITLDLTITTEVNSIDQQTACNTYTWIDGNTYTTNNNIATHTIIGGGSSGCDSVTTLDLTIINAVTSTDIQSACDSYTWIDGVTYSNNNNTAADTLFGGSVNGCDSITSLDLTILNSPNVNPVTTEDTINIGDEVTLSVIDSGLNYQWSNGIFGNYITVFPTETEIFNVVASNELCSDTGYIKIVVLNEEVNLLIPDAFSPNNDGINDLFRIVNSDDFMDITLHVYNRWGELIFDDLDNSHAWDGTYKSTAQNTGYYFYYIAAKSKDSGQQFQISGDLSLIR